METTAAAAPTQSVSLDALVAQVPGLRCADADTGLINQLHDLEVLKNACSGAQAKITLALRQLREHQARVEGRPVRRIGVGVAGEVGLARKESPHRATTLVGLATVLASEMPHTLDALCAGRISEYRAILLTRETACVSREDRIQVDAELAGRIECLSDREIVGQARQITYRLDPHSAVERVARAETDRRVTIRPAPDCMAQISALLPVAQGVAVYATLVHETDHARNTGDQRSKGQVMADTLVTRITGQTTAEAVPVKVGLVMTDETLLGDGDTPARLEGSGPLPAGVARRLAGVASKTAQLWVRRLYTRPKTGELVAMDTKQRLFPDTMKEFITIRDQVCRTPWCGAPIRHIDHVTPVHAGGQTSIANGQGLCERCNYIKEHAGWQARPTPDGTAVTTPTGHQHSGAPPLPHETTPFPGPAGKV